MGIAFLLPPVGVGLTIAAGIARVDIDDVSRSYVPYLIALFIGLALFAAFQVLTLVLPRRLGVAWDALSPDSRAASAAGRGSDRARRRPARGR